MVKDKWVDGSLPNAEVNAASRASCLTDGHFYVVLFVNTGLL